AGHNGFQKLFEAFSIPIGIIRMLEKTRESRLSTSLKALLDNIFQACGGLTGKPPFPDRHPPDAFNVNIVQLVSRYFVGCCSLHRLSRLVPIFTLSICLFTRPLLAKCMWVFGSYVPVSFVSAFLFFCWESGALVLNHGRASSGWPEYTRGV